MAEDETRYQQLQREVIEIVGVLLRDHPPGTPIGAVWDEALSIHRLQSIPEKTLRTELEAGASR